MSGQGRTDDDDDAALKGVVLSILVAMVLALGCAIHHFAT